MDLKKIKHHVLRKLEDLPKDLKYHCIDHTLDVYEQAGNIAEAENISDPEMLYLLKIAALYHDTGFLFVYKGHEEIGCKMAREELPAFGVNGKQLDIICGLIMATKLPQSPTTHLEKIICDADLDYLGRNDYNEISHNLYLEFLKEKIVKNEVEWLEKQIGFFESHEYFTGWSRTNRGPLKAIRLEKLKALQKKNNLST